MSKNPVSMSGVIDRLFTRLAATYGPEWTRQCGATPMTDIKTVWGHELAGYINNLPAIAHALDILPERCPNVIQFRNLCRTAPAATVLMLPEPKSDPARIKAVLAQMPTAAAVGRLDWARALQRKDDANPHTVTQTIRTMYRDALGLNRTMPAGEAAAEQGAAA